MPKRSQKRKAGRFPSDVDTSSRAPGAGSNKFAWGTAALVAVAVTGVYGRAIHFPFIFDDSISIQTNETIVSLWPLWGDEGHRGPLNPSKFLPTSGRPLVNLSFALNYWFGELQPAGYRIANMFLHLGSAVLLGAIVRRTLRRPYFAHHFDDSADWLSMAVALLWAVHPLHTEAVSYVTQRTELMVAFFYLATLYCSLRYWAAGAPATADYPQVHGGDLGTGLKSPSSGWLVLASMSCLAGAASKEVMATAPLVILLFERAFVAGSLVKSLRQSWPLYCGLACSCLLLLLLHRSAPRGDSVGFHLGVPAHVWWLTQTKVLLMYLKLVAWPWPLVIHYDLPYVNSLAESWMYWLPIALLGFTTLALLWRNHAVGFLSAAVFAVLAPTLVVPIVTEAAAERRMYLPLAAILPLAVVGGYQAVRSLAHRSTVTQQSLRAWRWPTFSAAVVIILVAATWSAVSFRRLGAFESEMTLWRQAVRLQPHDHIAHANLGTQLFNAGHLQEAMKHYHEAIRLKPDSSQAHYNLALGLLKLKQPREAAAEFREAVRYMPDSPRLMNNLGVALFIAGDNDEAIRVFQQTIKLDPTMWRAYDNLGSAFSRAKRYSEAIKCFEQALRFHSQAVDVYSHLADAQARLQQYPAAIETLEKALLVAGVSGEATTAAKLDAQLSAYRDSLARVPPDNTKTDESTQSSN
jgi:tetratricopeptide (TPR) repeat protein